MIKRKPLASGSKAQGFHRLAQGLVLPRLFICSIAMTGPIVCETARADNAVRIFGIIDEYAGRQQYAGQVSKYVLNSGGLITSRWGVSGSEDLGDGLSATFNLAALFRADTGESGRFPGDAFWSTRSTVGFAGPFGAVDLGRWNSPQFYSLARYDAFGLATIAPIFLHNYPGGQPLTAPQATSDAATNNAIFYSSPALGGFKFVVDYGLAETTPTKGRSGFSVDYTVGDFSVGVAGDHITGPLPSGENKQNSLMVGSTYDFKIVKFFATAKNEKQYALGNEYRMLNFGAQVPIGLARFAATYTQTKLDRRVLQDQTRRTAALGVDYYLSKRTDLYAVATYDRVTNLNNGKTLVGGIRHAF